MREFHVVPRQKAIRSALSDLAAFTALIGFILKILKHRLFEWDPIIQIF
jgi:hypothetical protein